MTCTGAGPGTPLQKFGTSPFTSLWLPSLTVIGEMMDINVLMALVNITGEWDTTHGWRDLLLSTEWSYFEKIARAGDVTVVYFIHVLLIMVRFR